MMTHHPKQEGSAKRWCWKCRGIEWHANWLWKLG